MNITIAKLKLFFGGEIPKSETKAMNVHALNDELNNFIDDEFLFKYEMAITSTEDSKDNVTTFVEYLTDSVTAMGQVILNPKRLTFLRDILRKILNYDLPCFKKGDEDEEDSENHPKLFSELLILMVEISNILGPDSNEFICSLIPDLEKALSKGDLYEYEEIMGHFCDIIENNPSILNHLADKLTQLVFNSKNMRDEAVSRNAAFCTGIMFEQNPQVMLPHLNSCLNYLQALQAEAHLDILKDNIISAVSKIYSVDPNKTVPANVLIQNIVQSCPFKGDKEENGPMCVVLAKMTEKDPEVVAANLQKVLEIMLDAV